MSNRRLRLEVPSAEKFVSNAIKTVGIEDTTYGYLPHKIRVSCIKLYSFLKIYYNVLMYFKTYKFKLTAEHTLMKK